MSFLPDLLTAVDAELAGISASSPLLQPTDSLGISLSFDWQRLRFRVDSGGSPIIVSEHEALLEDVVKMLLTPRYRVMTYSPEYGADWDELIGQPLPLVKTEIPRIVTEAIMIDPRISSVYGFEITTLPDVSDGVRVAFSIRDFTGVELRVPEVVLRYG